METKPRYTAETVTVFPVNMEKLNAHIDTFLHKDKGFPANITYRVHGTMALMRDPRLCIIDDEFVGRDLTDEKITFYVHETEQMPDGHHIGHCLPTHEVSMSLMELVPYLKGATSLAEFTQDRRGYNSRIQSNEREWIKYLNKA